MIVIKFGGSSLGTPERVLAALDIVAAARTNENARAVVCSAFGGATDQLLQTAALAATGNPAYRDGLQAFIDRHREAVTALFPENRRQEHDQTITTITADLINVLSGVALIRELSPRTQDFIVSFGERLSCYLVAACLRERGIPADYCDARRLVRTDDSFGSAKVDFDITNPQIRAHFKSHEALQIVTGFIGSTENEETTTLGRGGSDYTVSIFGAALGVAEIQIWTDVDGVLTADPRKVPRAFTVEQLTYEEAMELAHFGAKVIYPPTMAPAMREQIPLRIKNTFRPEVDGTLVGREREAHRHYASGISSIDEVTLLQLSGAGMIAAAGIAGRLFAALAAAKVNVILISQGSSEHSICVAVAPKDAILAERAVNEAFTLEINRKQVEPVQVETRKSVIALVGEQMRLVPGIAARIFQTLAGAKVNVVAIAQGSSERNVSFVVDAVALPRALRALHDGFFFPEERNLYLFLLGHGLVGRALAEQLQARARKNGGNTHIKVTGLANSRVMAFDEQGFDLADLDGALAGATTPSDLEAFLQNAVTMPVPHKILVDNTAGEAATELYQRALDAGISVVTPNKKANTRDLAFYDSLHQKARRNHAGFFYETNVGAGLPVIGPLQDLLQAGDQVNRIVGMMSGTLSYLFHTFDGAKPFSRLVTEAKAAGYTEPDPREDLNGMDVARKLVILAREAGYRLELDDVDVESLIPAELRAIQDADDFMAALPDFDHQWRQRLDEARVEDKVLRYIASYTNGKARVALEAVGTDHPFYATSGSDNMFCFYTNFYPNTPLTIRGPGAGATVTAAGVLGDILKAGRGN